MSSTAPVAMANSGCSRGLGGGLQRHPGLALAAAGEARGRRAAGAVPAVHQPPVCGGQHDGAADSDACTVPAEADQQQGHPPRPQRMGEELIDSQPGDGALGDGDRLVAGGDERPGRTGRPAAPARPARPGSPARNRHVHRQRVAGLDRGEPLHGGETGPGERGLHLVGGEHLVTGRHCAGHLPAADAAR